jgi:hypothetical protein
MSSITSAGASTLLRQGSFIFFLLSRSFSRLSSLVGTVAMGWQTYDLTGSALRSALRVIIRSIPTRRVEQYSPLSGQLCDADFGIPTGTEKAVPVCF